MKKVLTLFVLAFLGVSLSMHAIDITKVDRVQPTDEIFMDMATTAAKKSLSSGGPAAGAVIILNGAWRATGVPTATSSAEEVAFEKARLGQLNQANIYTINEPTTEAINFLNKLNVNAIYFVNGRDAVVAAGIYPADAYDDSKLEGELKPGKLMQISFPEAEALLKK